nr:terpene synthase 10-like [Ipomoea batatas]
MAAILSVLSTSTYKLPSIHRSHAASSFSMCYHTTTTTTRRSGNYGPPTWDFTYIQSLNTTTYTGERFVTRRDELKEKVKDMLKNEEMKEVEKMEMIDELQRLGETSLELGRDFSAKHLKHELKLPLHWRMPRLEARGFIDSYDKGKTTSNPILLELAKLDFNIVQAVHLEDLRFVSRWWKNSYIAERLTFVRDRVVENFFWTIGSNPNPKYVNGRRTVAKLNCLICTVDDIYDVYGTFCSYMTSFGYYFRWDDVTKVEHLPDYMRLCYLALNNFVNEVAYDILKQHGIFILHHLRKSWADLCKAYLQEAKWYHSGYTPTFQEYIQNAWISIGCPIILVHAFLHVNNPAEYDAALHCLTDYHEIIRLSSMILRLANDKGTSPDELKRGDVPKAIQCYMGEAKASVNDARGFIDLEMNEIWKKMNKFRLEGGSPFSGTFIEVAMNVARMAQCMYQHGDGHGIKNFETQTRIQTGERFVTRRDELKERVKNMLNNEGMGEVEKMEMIDELQRLGCSYHFEEEIMAALMDIYMKKKKSSNNKGLYATALEFRVLRQNGFNISQDVFDGFMDGKRSGFNANLCEDTKGLLNLYESSFLSMEGETTLELARDFSAKHLKHALKLPLHWRMPRLEARGFIDSYDKGKTTSDAILLELAKLDFNIVQAVHLEDLRFVSRWWKNSYIAEKLTFVRDRVVENFFWGIGSNPNPKYVNYRRTVAKLNCFICTVDDIYDVYGTLDELQLFTDTIERWDDVTKVEHLPDYMRLCYFALNNFVNELAYDILKEHGIFILHHLRKSDELKRGDVPKAIQCYMGEAKASVDDARGFIDLEMNEIWKKMNKVRLEGGSPFSGTFIEVAMNIARVAQCIYQHGDGHGIKNLETQSRIQTLLFEPIPLINNIMP